MRRVVFAFSNYSRALNVLDVSSAPPDYLCSPVRRRLRPFKACALRSHRYRCVVQHVEDDPRRVLEEKGL